MNFLNKIKIISLLILVLLFSKCNSSYKESNKNVINIRGTEILKNAYGAIEISLIDTILLVGTQGNDNFYSVYNAKSLKLIGNLGVKGNGPDDWLAPVYSGQYINTDTSILIWINDVFRYRFMLVNLTKSLLKNKPVIEKEFHIDPSLYLTQNLIYINDSLIIGNLGMDAINRGRLCFYNPHSKATKVINLFPKVRNINKFTNYELYEIYFDKIRYNENKHLIVSAMEKFDRIDVFNLNGKIVNSITGKDIIIDGLKNTKNGELKGLKNYYEDVQTNDKYIYALYYNQPDEEYGKVIKPTEFRIFNWKGDCLAILRVPDYIMSFTVDKSNKWIFAVDYYNEKVLKYDISNIF